ncbi:spen_0 protein [Trichonephila inaurata madagascariensis]|uniref:Spen_0 protein n=1 Tax=Trichonephila inaurata madagascariensis TaxID=2747483 RepID=A0A8X6YSC8_9ARAC|nr:spen_0 protein [Trichonephila inaurata madagascariensis]
MWRGYLAIEDAQAMVMMYYISGDFDYAKPIFPQVEVNSIETPSTPMRITETKQLVREVLDEVTRRTKSDNEHCAILAIPCGKTSEAASVEGRIFKQDFLKYLKDENCMGIVKGRHPEANQPDYLMAIFPDCEFVSTTLNVIPLRPVTRRDLHHYAHSLIIIVKAH